MSQRFALLFVASFATLVAPAAAGPRTFGFTGHSRDGVYGRFKGALDLSWKLGSQVLSSSSSPALSVGGSAHYYSLLGVNLDLIENFAGEQHSSREARFGLELRPLFLPRWILGTERGPAWFDLSLDSVSVGLGGYVQRRGSHDPAVSTGTWASLGAALPLVGNAAGPWLEVRGLYQFPDPEPITRPEAYPSLSVYLSWHHFLDWPTGAQQR